MSDQNTEAESNEQVAEYLRLSLAKLSELKLPITPVNYTLAYFYSSGKDITLTNKLDDMFKDVEHWNEDSAKTLFARYVCQCEEVQNSELREELLMTVAQIIGSLIDLTGKTSISNEVLETHIKHLAESREPKVILNIASQIIAETRNIVEQNRAFESALRESTMEINVLKDELDHVRKQATLDALTGLHNRRGFDQTIEEVRQEALSGRENFCLMIIDVDHFKDVNDHHGHLVGDKVLKGISSLLHSHMRGNDYLSRFGGEEFAIILRETPITGAFTVAENLRQSIEKLRLKHVKTGQQIGKVTISVGLAAYRQGETVIELIERCDRALYRAKSLGRNRTVLAD